MVFTKMAIDIKRLNRQTLDMINPIQLDKPLT